MPTLNDLLDILPRPLPVVTVVDLGAMSLGQGLEPYSALVTAGLARVIGFEAVPEEWEKLNSLVGPPHVFLPYAIGDGTVRTFYRCNYPMTSSLYEPNTPLLEKFWAIEELTRVVSRTEVATHRLDDIKALGDVDYFKLDIQGGEVDALRGAHRTLAGVVLIQTEACFVPLYKDQPLFAEIDQVLRAEGFLFHRFLGGISGRSFKPLRRSDDVPISQQLWSDVLYARSFMHLDRLPPAKLLKMALLLHQYDSWDLAHVVLTEYDRRGGTALAESYMHRLTGTTPP